MDKARKKARGRRGAEIQDGIRQILFDEWAPLGMNNELPSDEYDCCMAPVYRALVDGASEEQLVFLLSSLEPHFGCTRRTAHVAKRNTARRLCSLNIRLIEKNDA